MRPNPATLAPTHDDNPRNDGSTHAPQVQHTVHANVTQEGTISGPLANADALDCSNVGPHAARSRNALRAMTCAVEYTGAHRGTPPQRGRRKTQ
jgi:hypothetical protein